MDEMEIKAPAQPDVNELQAQFEALRHLVISLLVLALVISGTLTIYLLRQWRFTHSELAPFRPVATQMINDYERRRPVMDQFLVRLADHGKTHPELIPLLNRYGLRSVSPTNVPIPTVMPPKIPAKK